MNRKLVLLKDCLLGALSFSIISYVFYRSIYIMLLFFLIGISYGYLNIGNREEKRKKQLLVSFNDLLSFMYSSLLSGNSFRNSLDQGINEIENINNEDELILYLDKLILNINTGINEVEAWRIFSHEIDLEECYEFVDVLEQTYNSGGQITKVINRTCQILSDKIDLLLEVDLLLSSKKFEFKIMMIAPVILLGLISFSSSGYMEILYTSIVGRIAMSIVLILMIIAYLIGKQIIKIEL